MKLIDLLVQELPRRGGWPEGVYVIEQNYHGKLFNGSKPSEPFLFDSEKFEMVDAWREARVTREQYEAALAASQRCVHEWIPSEGRTPSGVLCRKCGDYDGPGEDEKMKEPGQPAWDGDGLPPVGCECEVSVCGGWEPGRIVFSDENIGVAYVCESTSSPTLDCVSGFSALKHFRPIRSEADKRRDEAIAALKKLKPQLVGELAGYLYDEIAAGKIPHIRIEQAA
ncbi:hypothetical protein FZH95_00155 [Cronobacter sakazakii]|nr:hypothetical protein [Cronobacter sakazakii]ELY4757056.1 hypothetical protein [Cronobacter sakazakii]ELY4769568.1 hypothetical protein [Cronobacter sakazakii]KAB1502680.1 hypothetical protein FZH95_00155 [Cronobacter sakazakii]